MKGKLWIQTTPWWSPADFWACEQSLLMALGSHWGGWAYFKSNSTPGGYWAEAIVVWPSFHSLPLKSWGSQLWFLFSSDRQLQCWTAGPWEGWWGRIPFTVFAALGLSEPGGYKPLSFRAALLGGPVYWSILIFFMDFLKSYFFYYISCLLRFLSILYGYIESNPGPGSDRSVRGLYSNIRGLHANLNEERVFMLRIPRFASPKQRPRNSTSGVQGALSKLVTREGRAG